MCLVCDYLAGRERAASNKLEMAEQRLRASEYGSQERTEYTDRVNKHALELFAVWSLQYDHEQKFHRSE